MQNLSQTLKQDLLPVIEWGSPSDTELQHAADRIRDVAPPEMVDITWPIPPRFPLSQLAYANYQDSNLITQSELKGMMNDNSENGKIQDWYLHSYIPTMSVHRPRHV